MAAEQMPECLERISFNSSVPLFFKLGAGNIQHHAQSWTALFRAFSSPIGSPQLL